MTIVVGGFTRIIVVGDFGLNNLSKKVIKMQENNRENTIVESENGKYLTLDDSGLIDDFLSGKSKETVRAYEEDLRGFGDWFGNNAEDAIRQLLNCGPGKANQVVVKYKNNLTERGLSPATVNRRLAALRSIVALAKKFGLVSWTLDVDNVKHENYRNTAGPGESGYRKMLQAAKDRQDRKGIRDIAILRLLHDLGLRRGEIVNLDMKHVDLESGKISVLGKGKKQRQELDLPDSTLQTLINWIKVRGNQPGPLFVTLHHGYQDELKRITGCGIGYICRQYGRETGVKNCNPHALRHTAITKALDKTNGNVRAVQRFSRHAKLDTLMIYDDNRKNLAKEVADLVADDSGE